MSCLHFVLFAFCHICILLHLYFVSFAFCYNCIMSYLHLLYLQFDWFAFCYICILSGWHFVWFAFCLFWRFVTFAFCPICILSRIHIQYCFMNTYTLNSCAHYCHFKGWSCIDCSYINCSQAYASSHYTVLLTAFTSSYFIYNELMWAFTDVLNTAVTNTAVQSDLMETHILQF